MTQGLINDGKIPQVELNPPEISLEAIPEQHRRRFFNAGELNTLAYLLRDKKCIVEIGCQNGRTAKAILSNRPDIEFYIGIDVPPGTPLACDVQKAETPERAGELALDDPRFVLMLAKNGSANLKSLLPTVDAVFIDGDHSRDAVLRDHELAEFLLSGSHRISLPGIIIHHDYHSLGTVGVREALLEMQEAGKRFTHVAGTWLVYSEV
jgi:hypothetical protein